MHIILRLDKRCSGINLISWPEESNTLQGPEAKTEKVTAIPIWNLRPKRRSDKAMYDRGSDYKAGFYGRKSDNMITSVNGNIFQIVTNWI